MSVTEYNPPVQGDVRRSFGDALRGVRQRRFFDIAVAALAVAVLSPVIVLVILVIWIESGRPILFSQMRLGYRGKQFRIYKFRKFYPENTAPGCPLTVRNDSRMTPVGRFLEKSKLDELPQLWNVLRGDMSFVGPRPETPNFKDCFDQDFSRVLEYRPGILGPSQAFVRNESSLYPQGADPVAYYRAVLFPLKARIDIAYYKNGSLASDIGWIIRCFLVVFGFNSNCPPKLVMNVRSNQHAEAPASWHIADLVKLLAAEYEDELQSGIGANANLRSRGEPSHVLEAESLVRLPNEASSHKVELV
jgi:lipopolysaccharide/colanic/teichoic acid biosynthesis glycosyltransferase